MCVECGVSVLVVLMALGRVLASAASLVGQGCFLPPPPTTKKKNNNTNTFNYGSGGMCLVSLCVYWVGGGSW